MTPKKTTTSTGRTAAAPAPHNGFSLISTEMLLRLHRAMVECRVLARRFGKSWNLSPGSEAVLAGTLLTLEKRDAVQPGARGPLAAHIRGRKLETILNIGPAPVVSAAASARAAVAKARRLKAAGKGAALAAFAMGPLDPAWHRALSAASAERLPLLLVSEGRAAEAPSDPATNAVAGAPRLPVDAADAVAVFRVATECLSHARRGNGPSLIECLHFTPVRSSQAVEKMEHYLARKALLRAQQAAAVRKALNKALRYTKLAAKQ